MGFQATSVAAINTIEAIEAIETLPSLPYNGCDITAEIPSCETHRFLLHKAGGSHKDGQSHGENTPVRLAIHRNNRQKMQKIKAVWRDGDTAGAEVNKEIEEICDI